MKPRNIPTDLIQRLETADRKTRIKLIEQTPPSRWKRFILWLFTA